MALQMYEDTLTYCGWCEQPWHLHLPGHEARDLQCRDVKGVRSDPDRDRGHRYLGSHWYAAEQRFSDLVGPEAWARIERTYEREEGRAALDAAKMRSLEVIRQNVKSAGPGHRYLSDDECDACTPGFPAPHHGGCGHALRVHAAIIDRGRGQRLTTPRQWDRVGGLLAAYSAHVDHVFTVTACELCGGSAGGATWRDVKWIAAKHPHWQRRRRLHQSGAQPQPPDPLNPPAEWEQNL